MEVINVSVAESYKLMTEKGIHLLDVRTAHEHSEGHPPEKNEPKLIQWKIDNEQGRIDNPSFISDFMASFPAKDTPVMLLCRSGARSTAAVKALSQHGYTKLMNVDGGWLKWAEEGLPSKV